MLDNLIMRGLYGIAEPGTALILAKITIGPGGFVKSDDRISIKQREAGLVQFIYKDQNDEPVDVSLAEFSFKVSRPEKGGEYLIEKNDAAFDKAQGAAGIVELSLTADDNDIDPGKFVSEIKTVLSPSSLDISRDIPFIVAKSVEQPAT